MPRPAKAPDLAPVDMELPLWPALVRARRRLEAVRSATGRMATLVGAAAAAAGLFTGQWTGASLLADAALTLIGLGTLRLWKPDGQQRAVASVLYLAPGTSLAALLLAEQMVPGIHPVEALGLTVWTAGTWVMRPAYVGRRMLAPPPPAPAAELATLEEAEVSDHPIAQWWARTVAVKDGAAPGTVLDDIHRTGPKSMRAVIRATTPGRPVPDISIRNLSAAMDIPEDLITIGPVPGRGAGVRLLTIGNPEESEDLATVWDKRIAPAAMPGAVLTSVRAGRPGGAGHTITTTASTTTSTEEDA
ncbi:hypothetical protein EDD27_1465 [Nonomuraea polychroma]|uniref:Uncharacterized protein n=1 Tax=Nonomuraea polychroma TaxID=46176 RepID=A0A438M062_9ACTN|nr:hypothetical protein [Nonomuraea polychroma]RVX39122.1 hypothetical protein EDD27_1465 [Nonomuraea polychroma]